jgi:hypothetical protein
MAIIEETKDDKGKVVEKSGILLLLGGMWNGAMPESNIKLPQWLKMEPLYYPAIPLLCTFSKNWNQGLKKEIFISMFIAALFTKKQVMETTQMFIWQRKYHSIVSILKFSASRENLGGKKVKLSYLNLEK